MFLSSREKCQALLFALIIELPLIALYPLSLRKSRSSEPFIEGDMLINSEQLATMHSKRKVQARSGLIALHFRWPNGEVPYTLDDSFSLSDLEVIDAAMTHIESGTCIRFKPITQPLRANSSLLLIELRSQCASWVGQQGNEQSLTLAKGCMKFGSVAHELMHTLGFYHQQGSPDRDNYVLILKENIQPTHYSQFEKYSANFIDDFGVPYDYSSVMHYNQYAYSKNGLPTIVPIEADVKIGRRDGLSDGDFLKINRMYNCVDYL